MVESQSGPVATHDDVHHLVDALRETREQLDATDQILSVLSISSSTADDVFEVIVDRARALCRADVAQVHLVRGDEYYLVCRPAPAPTTWTSPRRRRSCATAGR